MKIIVSLLFFLLLASCSKSSGKTLSTDSTDCYPHRKVILSYNDKPGVIAKVGDYYIISDQSGKRRFQPCMLDEAFRREGLEVRFTGDQVEVNPGERRYALPLRLFSIRIAQ